MKRSTMVAIGSAAAGLAGGVAAAAALVTTRKHRHLAGGVIYRSADEGSFEEIMPGVSRSVMWGNPNRGAHAAFTRFKPGQRNALHMHTTDITIVVVGGAYIYETKEGKVRVGKGQSLFIPGGTPHVSGADPKEGALFFQTSPGAFDLRYLD